MDWLNQLLGFLVVLFILLFPLLRKLVIKKAEVKEKVLPPNEEEVEVYEEAPLILKLPPKEERKSKHDFEFHSGIEEREFSSRINKRQLKINVSPKFEDKIVSEEWLLLEKKKPKTRKTFLTSLKKRPIRQSMVLSSEILQLPKALNHDEH